MIGGAVGIEGAFSMELVDFLPRNPLRPVCWRWGLAVCLVRDRLRVRKAWGDDWVRRATRYHRKAARLGDPAHPGLSRLDPVLDGARRLRYGGDPRLRLEVEARVLAGQGDPEIAAACALDADVVGAYAALFFDVRGRLGARDYIAVTISPSLLTTGHEPDPAAAVRRLAFLLGPAAVGPALAAAFPPDDPAGLAADPRLVRRARAAIDLMAVPVTARNAPLLVRLGDRVREAGRDGAGASAAAAWAPVSTPAGFGSPGLRSTGASATDRGPLTDHDVETGEGGDGGQDRVELPALRSRSGWGDLLTVLRRSA